MRFRIWTSLVKATDPESEVFCSTAVRTLLLLHHHADAFQSISKPELDRKPSLSSQVRSFRLRHGKRTASFSSALQKCTFLQSKGPEMSTGRETLSLAMLSPFLSPRLHESVHCRRQGESKESIDVLDRKYLDHIETCIVQNAKERQQDLKARRMDVDPGLQIFPFITHSPLSSAEILVSIICRLIEQDVPFKRIWTQVEKMYHNVPRIRGIRIACAGRTSRKATKAKTTNVRVGSTSLATFSRDVDYAAKTAITRYGSIGLKVWIAFD